MSDNVNIEMVIYAVGNAQAAVRSAEDLKDILELQGISVQAITISTVIDDGEEEEQS